MLQAWLQGGKVLRSSATQHPGGKAAERGPVTRASPIRRSAPDGNTTSPAKTSGGVRGGRGRAAKSAVGDDDAASETPTPLKEEAVTDADFDLAADGDPSEDAAAEPSAGRPSPRTARGRAKAATGRVPDEIPAKGDETADSAGKGSGRGEASPTKEPPAPDAGTEDTSGLSAYELQRQQNIRRNQAILESLEIPSMPAPSLNQGRRGHASPAGGGRTTRSHALPPHRALIQPHPPSGPSCCRTIPDRLREGSPADSLGWMCVARCAGEEAQPRARARGGKRKPALAFAEQERRTSSRRAAMAADGGAREAARAQLVALPDAWDDRDEAAAGRGGAGRRRAALFEEEEPDCAALVAPPDMEELLEELAQRQSSSATMRTWCAEAEAAPGGAPGAPDWQAFAEARWGPLVRRSKCEDWEGFVVSRCPVHPGAEGSGMLQERFCGDVWRLLVACILMSRVSSAETKDRCLAAFFAAYPTPSAFKVAKDGDVFPLVKPLGLFDSRIKGLRDVTLRFLEMPRFMLGLAPPLKPAGIGVFGYESYLIFACGEGPRIRPDDKNLSGYCAWLRRALAAHQP